MMTQEELSHLSDNELLAEKEKLKKSKITSAVFIGFLAGVLIFGLVAWMLGEEKNFGFFIPMFIPIIFIYKLVKGSKNTSALEQVIRDRGL